MTPEKMYAMNMDGRSFNEIARRCGKTKGAVAGAIYRYRMANGLPSPTGCVASVPGVKAPDAPLGVSSFAEAIDKKTCLYIAGDPRNGSAVYCGNERKAGKPYCEEHCAVCYKPPKQRGKELTLDDIRPFSFRSMGKKAA